TLNKDNPASNASLNINVHKDDKVYFRTSSIYSGTSDEIYFNPVIQYNSTTSEIPDYDINGFDLKHYDSKKDFCVSGNSLFQSPDSTVVTISAVLNKDILTDDIVLCVEKILGEETEYVLLDTIKSLDVVQDKLWTYEMADFSRRYNYNFKILTTSLINWSGVDWQVNASYLDKNGQPHEQVILPEYQYFNKRNITKPLQKISLAEEDYNSQRVKATATINSFVFPDEENDEDFMIDSMFFVLKTEKLGKIISKTVPRKGVIFDFSNCVFELPDSIFTEDMEISLNVPEEYDLLIPSSSYDITFEHEKITPYNDTIYYSFYRDSIQIDTFRIELKYDTSWVNMGSYVPCIYSAYDDVDMGCWYRNWGQFAYNGNKTPWFTINRSPLNLPQDLAISNVMNESKLSIAANGSSEENTDKKSLKKKYKILKKENKKKYDKEGREVNEDDKDDFEVKDPKDAHFYMMSYNVQNKRYVASTPYAYFSGDTICPARLGELEIDTTSIQFEDGDGMCSAPSLITKSRSNSFGADAGVQVGGANASLGRSWGWTNMFTENMLMDLNGDGYPDWIYRKKEYNAKEDKDNPENNFIKVRYTDVKGNLQEPYIQQNVDMPKQKAESKSESNSIGYTYSKKLGERTSSYLRARNIVIGDNEKGAISESASANVGVSASGNIGNSTSENLNQWCDLNGDGLQDMVYSDGVCYNLGRSFTEKMPIAQNILQKSESSSKSQGLSLSISVSGDIHYGASIAGGVNFGRSDSEILAQVLDINADGLPDILRESKNGGLEMLLNEGELFTAPQKWHFNGINDASSASRATFANVGVSIPIIPLLKISPSIKSNFSQSVSRTNTSLMDIDGDGFPDLLSYSNEDELLVRRSRIGNTNYLTKIVRPLGDSIVLHYEKTKNSYDMPHCKYVLSEVDYIGGMAENGATKIHQSFEYKGGHYDRYERTFFGFDTIVSNQYLDGKVYRKTIQTYDSKDFYRKDLPVSETVLNAK
ncbi:MAG: hypothetical protein IJ270_07450, partial [Paludibacteraceae bacterium]|nr:hypothetical protein [Paludibacteraceae bacterium]